MQTPDNLYKVSLLFQNANLTALFRADCGLGQYALVQLGIRRVLNAKAFEIFSRRMTDYEENELFLRNCHTAVEMILDVTAKERPKNGELYLKRKDGEILAASVDVKVYEASSQDQDTGRPFPDSETDPAGFQDT